MRALISLLLINILLLPELNGQNKNKGLDFQFSLVHPVKKSMEGYEFSADPTLQLLYFTSLTKKVTVAGGLFVQAGKHKWLELYGHTFYDDYGMPYPLRTDYDRQLEFVSLGIPVKLELATYSILFDALIFGFTAGNHIKLNMADYFKSEFVADIPVTDLFNALFWELNAGFRKILYRKGSLTLSLLPVAGYRHESPLKTFGYYNYLYYGLGISARFGN